MNNLSFICLLYFLLCSFFILFFAIVVSGDVLRMLSGLSTKGKISRLLVVYSGHLTQQCEWAHHGFTTEKLDD